MAQETREAALSYLNAELDHSTSMWQHFGDRIDKEVQYYFLLVGFAITLVGVLLQIKVNLLAMVLTIQCVALLAGVVGFRLVRRIVMLTGTSALYATQVALARRGFLSVVPTMQRYAILNDAGDKTTAHYFTPVSTQLSVRLLTIANAFFFAAVFFLLPLALYFAPAGPIAQNLWMAIYVGAFVLSILVAVIAILVQRRLIVTRGDKYLDHISHSAIQMINAPDADNAGFSI